MPPTPSLPRGCGPSRGPSGRSDLGGARVARSAAYRRHDGELVTLSEEEPFVWQGPCGIGGVTIHGRLRTIEPPAFAFEIDRLTYNDTPYATKETVRANVEDPSSPPLGPPFTPGMLEVTEETVRVAIRDGSLRPTAAR